MLRQAIGYWRQIALGLWILGLGILVYGSLSPSVGPPGAYQADKSIHFLAYAGVTALPLSALQDRRAETGVVVFMLLFGAVLELAQGLVPQRSSSLLDGLANGLGVFVAVAGARWLRWR